MVEKQFGPASRMVLGSAFWSWRPRPIVRADESEPKTSDRQAQKDDDYALMKVFVDTFDQVRA